MVTTEEHIRFVEEQIKLYKPDDLVNEIKITSIYEKVTGGKCLVNFTTPLALAYVLGSFVKMMTGKRNLKMIHPESGQLGVWVHHETFLKRFRWTGLKKQGLQRFIMVLKNDLKLIDSKRVQSNFHTKMFYFLTDEGVHVLGVNLLKRYKSAIIEFMTPVS